MDSTYEQEGHFPGVTRYCRHLLDEVRPNIYRTTYIVKNFPYASRLDMYCVVEPGKRALLVDVGWSEICGTEILDEIVRRFGLSWENVDIFITHSHWDHVGNLEYCLSKGARVVYHGLDFPLRKADYDLFLRQTGSRLRGEVGHEESALRALRGLPEMSGISDLEFQDVTLIGCEEIDIAGYRFRPVITPGHAPEHVCLLEADHKFLFAGDHIVAGKPLASQYRAGEHVLVRYLHALSSIARLGLDEVYMSHCDPLEGADRVRTEVVRLMAFYDKPLSRVATMVTNSPEPVSAYEMAWRFHAGRGGKRFGELDPMARMRRISIQFMYLEYLYDTGAINRQMSDDGVLLYSALEQAIV